MGSRFSHDWTDERLGLAKALWADGHSASQIAKQLGGVTRNAVIGKLNRAGLQRAPATAPSRAPRTQAKVFGATKVKLAKPRLKLAGNGAVIEEAEARAARAIPFADAFTPLPGTTPQPFTERAFNQCAWPVGGESADTLSCCAPIHARSWCKGHFLLGTQPMKKHQTAKAYERGLRRWAA